MNKFIRELSMIFVLKYSAIFFLLASASLLDLIFFDNRLIPNSSINVWIKPIKFFLSFAIHSISLIFFTKIYERNSVSGSYLKWAIWIQIFVMWTELICINVQSIRGVDSHFNYQTIFDIWVFRIMGWGISVLLISQFMILYELSIKTFTMSEIKIILIIGVIISILGSSIGFIMVIPTSEQKEILAQGLKVDILGSHLAGVDTQNILVPFLGWNLSAGDWRVSHFIGIHGFQFYLVIALLYEKYNNFNLFWKFLILFYAAVFLISILFTLKPKFLIE